MTALTDVVLHVNRIADELHDRLSGRVSRTELRAIVLVMLERDTIRPGAENAWARQLSRETGVPLETVLRHGFRGVSAAAEAHSEPDLTEIGWAIIDQLGHKRLAGYVCEVELAGHRFLRVDIANADGETIATQFIEPGSVYALTPTSRQVCLGLAHRIPFEPVKPWELERPVACAPGPDDEPEWEDEPPEGELPVSASSDDGIPF